jgi:hypothetical protein
MRTTIIVLFTLCLIAGCVTGTDSTGQKTYSLDPNTGKIITTGVTATNAIVTTAVPVASVIWPQFAILFAAIGAGVGYAANLWSKLNPVLAAARNKTQIVQAVLSGVVKAVEAVGEQQVANPGGSPAETVTVAEVVKEQVATNLDVAGLTSEGKALISEAKL